MGKEPSIEAVKAAKRESETYLRSLPNVTGLGVGPKIRAGAATGELAIKVFVSRKLPLAELATHERVPETVGGIPTDVEVMAPLRARNRTGEQA